MPITDLTGKTLTFNQEPILLSGQYYINFYDEYNDYSLLDIASNRIKYNDNPVYSTGIWFDDTYRTITITGGTDATNADLIAWLLENSDLQPEPEPTSNISSFNSMSITDNEGYITINIGDTSFDFKKHEGEAPITDLTGTKWQINDTTCSAGYGEFDVNFSVTNAYDQTQLLIGYTFSFNTGATPQANTIRVLPNNGELSVGDWISFTGGTDVTNSDLIAWLQANATQIPANQVNLISFTIGKTPYQAEEGMTWNDWVNSEYNTSEDELVVEQNGSGAVRNVSTGGYVSTFPSIGVAIPQPVSGSDEIIESTSYGYSVISGGGSSN